MTTSGSTDLSVTERLLPAFKDGVLPAPPADLLLLGEFPDAGVALKARGYRIERLPWRQPSFREPLPAGARGELLQVRLRAPELAGRRFDAVLALDLAPDIHPLALFDELDTLLAPDGVVVLAGPMAREDATSHWLDYLAALGGRCGFSMDEPGDGAASPFFSRVFRRSATPPRWRVNHVLPENFAEVSALFQEVFGHPMSRELWEWKYGAGRGNAVMARNDGKVVAHYGGMYRDILSCGKPDRVAQICDVMVQSRERGVLTRQGPFFLLGASWPEVYGPKGFGFPSERHIRLAEKMGLYVEAGQLAEVRWEPASAGVRLGTKVRHVDPESAADKAMVNGLWARMAEDLRDGVVGIRDWDFVVQRYFRHPHHKYEVLAVSARFTGRPLGIAVLRRHEACCELLDVIGPLSNLAPVIDQARRMTGRWGLPYMYCWITRNHLPRFLACGGREQQLDISIPASSWTADPQPEQFVGKWWLMSGDTDFH